MAPIMAPWRPISQTDGRERRHKMTGQSAPGRTRAAALCNTCCSEVLRSLDVAVTVTRKGQVTIPKPVRDRLGIGPGSKVDFEVAEDGRAFLRRVGKPKVKPSGFERMRGTATSGLTTDEIIALTRGEC
jgi:antitoxin PrlF